MTDYIVNIIIFFVTLISITWTSIAIYIILSDYEVVCHDTEGNLVGYSEIHNPDNPTIYPLNNGVYKNSITKEKFKGTCKYHMYLTSPKGRDYWE